MDTEKAFINGVYAVGKQAYKSGYEQGWNDCLDDMKKQLLAKKSTKKIVFQYYGIKESVS